MLAYSWRVQVANNAAERPDPHGRSARFTRTVAAVVGGKTKCQGSGFLKLILERSGEASRGKVLVIDMTGSLVPQSVKRQIA